MQAWILNRVTDLNQNPRPLQLVEIDDPVPADGELLLSVRTCGICHTELDEIEGRIPPLVFPMILGHQVVGEVIDTGDSVSRSRIGDRVGVGWVFSSCGSCEHCLSGYDNLCPSYKATGRDANGGYAQLMTVPENAAFPIPPMFNDSEAAPLLCAGAIGYRSLRLANLKNGQRLGLTGFGASGHLVLKLAQHLYPDSQIYVFARSEKERRFASRLGAVWTGEAEDRSPKPLHGIIDTTPVWKPVVEAMKNLESGGRLVINAIRKESVDKDRLLDLDYESHLWMEKEIKSVANVARRDIRGFLKLAAEIPIRPEVQEYPFESVNEALLAMKQGHIRGAKVLRIRE